MKENLKNKIQSVFLTLGDGSIVTFTGQAVCDVGETRSIVKIQFSEPRELPEGCSFGSID
jgi:hypothetical protein